MAAGQGMAGFCSVRENQNYSVAKQAAKPAVRAPFLPAQLNPINQEERKSSFCHFHFFKTNWHAYETELFSGSRISSSEVENPGSAREESTPVKLLRVWQGGAALQQRAHTRACSLLPAEPSGRLWQRGWLRGLVASLLSTAVGLPFPGCCSRGQLPLMAGSKTQTKRGEDAFEGRS